jgi:hypothetical protein
MPVMLFEVILYCCEYLKILGIKYAFNIENGFCWWQFNQSQLIMNAETIVFTFADYKRWQHVHKRYVTKLQVSAI